MGRKGGNSLSANCIRVNHRAGEVSAGSILLPRRLIKDMKWILMSCWTGGGQQVCAAAPTVKINPSYKGTKLSGQDGVPWRLCDHGTGKYTSRYHI